MLSCLYKSRSTLLECLHSTLVYSEEFSIVKQTMSGWLPDDGLCIWACIKMHDYHGHVYNSDPSQFLASHHVRALSQMQRPSLMRSDQIA